MRRVLVNDVAALSIFLIIYDERHRRGSGKDCVTGGRKQSLAMPITDIAPEGA
jgi:hypothetical protein